MRIYIATRETRPEQQRGRKAATKLLEAGQQVTSTWLYQRDPDVNEYLASELEEECLRDFRDIVKSDCLLMLTPKKWVKELCHPEIFGAALAFDKRLVLIGTENSAFHSLTLVEKYPDLNAFIAQLKEEEER